METKKTAQEYLKELPSLVRNLDSFRTGGDDKKPVDISLEEMVKESYGIEMNTYLETLGINTHISTMENLFTMPNQDIRWLVPEIIRSAINLGIKQAPFYPNIIASDQSISSLTAIMPIINPSDATPSRVNEAETIPLGSVSFGQKMVTLFKIGKGFKLTDEVRNYVSLDVIAIFLRDFGIQLGYAMDNLAMNVLINGNMPDGSDSAPVIGVADPTKSIQYRDLLRLWVRASRLGRSFKSMISDEEAAINLLDLPEFKDRQYGTPQAKLNVKTPIPNSADLYIHPGTPDNTLLLVDPRAALIKLTAKQLMLESERIVSNQTSAVYATLTTGFSKMYQDASVLLDASKEFETNGFPEFMNIDPYLTVNIEQ